MKFFAVCEKGIGEFAFDELSARFEIEPALKKNILVFDSGLEKAVEIAYLSQTITDLCILVSESMQPIEEALPEMVKNCKFSYKKNASMFSVNSVISSESDIDLNSFQLSNKAGSLIQKATGLKLSFREPDINFTIAAFKEYNLLGLSLFCTDLSKRPYRVFANKSSLNPTIASAFLIFSGINKGDKIVDPLAKDGTLILEAFHLLSGRPIRKCNKKEFVSSFSQEIEIKKILEKADEKEEEAGTLIAADSSFANLDALRKNAKIAGVEKKISLMKCTLADLEFKLMGKGVEKAFSLASPDSGKPSLNEAMQSFLSACHAANIKEAFLIYEYKSELSFTKTGFEKAKEKNITRRKSIIKFIKLRAK
jgi:23S rRNA G2445 N2-methylase RlmL